MRTAKIIINYAKNRYTDLQLSNKAQQVFDSMTGNGAFANPEPTLVVLEAAMLKYNKALANATGGGREATALKNDARMELENILFELAQYVQTVSGGNEALMLSAGFDVRKKPSPVGVLDKPKSLTVKTGRNIGEVELISAAVSNARFYIFEYMECPANEDSQWIPVVHTRHNVNIDGLKSRTEYAFRVSGGASNGVRVWSDVIYKNVI